MKIGIMLKHMGQHGGGVMVYTRGLLNHLFEIDADNDYVLIYQSKDNFGGYSKYENVKEVSIDTPTKFAWDQYGVRRLHKRERFDVIFNPKYSVPLNVDCPTAFVCHGLDWYVMPWASRFVDRLNHHFLIPRYAKRADAIIAVSNTAKDHLIQYLNVDADKVRTIYLGVDEVFRENMPVDKLARIKTEYNLPDNYFLYVGQIYPPKNFGRLLKAYAKVGPRLKRYLVVAGSHTWLCKEEMQLIEQLNLQNWVIRPGWIDRHTLPAFYQMAAALVLPSLYEACPSPPIEAMASGCPVVTADRYGTKEIAGGGALLVNPEDVDDIADKMEKVLTNTAVRDELIASGYAVSSRYSWTRCARETKEVLETFAYNPSNMRDLTGALRPV